MSSFASAVTVTGSRLGTPPLPARPPSAPPLRRSGSACAAICGGGWRGARAMARRPASETQAFAPPSREGTNSVQKGAFADIPTLEDMVKPPETVYTLERAKDELASRIASTGGDPRRAATTSDIVASCGITEHSKNFRDFTPEERANAVNRGPALEERMRKVHHAQREVQARRARRQQQQRGEACRRSASEPGSRPQSANVRPARAPSPSRSAGDTGSNNLAEVCPGAAGLLRRPTVSATDLMTAPALAVAALQKQAPPTSSVSAPASIVPSLKEIVAAFHKDDAPAAESASDSAVNAWQSHLRAGSMIAAFKPLAVAVPKASSDIETASRPASAGPKIKDWGAWHKVAAPETEKQPAAGFAPQPLDNKAKITERPAWMFPKETEDSAPSTASQSRPLPSVAMPTVEKKSSTGAPPSIVPQIKALIAAYEKDVRPGTAASEGAASTRSGSSRVSSRSRSSTISNSSDASRLGLKRGGPTAPAARPERPRSAGAVRRQASRTAHLSALLEMAERGTHMYSPRASGPKMNAWGAADGSESSASSCSSSSGVRSQGSSRIPRGAAYMPCPFPVSRGVLGIAVR